jgi:TIR domain
MKVFISYAHKEYQYANDLRSALEKPGIEPWLDERKLGR